MNVTGFYTEDEPKTVMQCSVVVYHGIFVSIITCLGIHIRLQDRG